MTRAGELSDSVRLHDRLGVLRRRKWLVLLAVVLVPAAAVAYSLSQQAQYQARADVLLGQQSPISSIAGTGDLSLTQDPQRVVDTETALAREPEVARRVLARAGVTDRTPEDFLAQSSVSAQTGTNLLAFRVTDHRREVASRLVNAYVNGFTTFVRVRTTGALWAALSSLRKRMDNLTRTSPNSPVLPTLVDKEQQLQTELALQASNASVVRTASGASQVEPQPVRNGILALVLGLVLGLAFAFGREALDTRVKTADQISSILKLPLLARIPKPPRRVRSKELLVMLADSSGRQAEPFRVLRTNLEFVNLDRQAKTIMVTSAVEQEGKSTTAANLAVALAKAGKNVALVDLDLRRPFIHRFFALNASPGLTDVALGHATLDKALTEVALTDSYSKTNGKYRPASTVHVLTSGPIPPDPGEFVASSALPLILKELVAQFDLVLVDSPPVLHVGDALTLSAIVDGIIVVTRLDLVRKQMLSELHRVLDRCPAAKLGCIVAGAESDEDLGQYGYGGYERDPVEARLREIIQ